MVEAITALRSCALCSASDSGAYVVATAMAYLPLIAPFSRAVRCQTAIPRTILPRTILQEGMGGYIDERRRSSPTRASLRLKRREIPQSYSPGLLAAMTVTGVSR